MHEHNWQPIPGECGRYQCDCGATGYRKAGVIVEHKQKLARKTQPTARTTSHGDWVQDRIRKDYDGE